jgi:uncharacterized RDD family membrane protein YckC
MNFVNESGHPIARPAHRFAALCVDAGFYIITLGIGWAIWNIVMWAQGQTPGKQMLKIRVYQSNNPSQRAGWGRMAIRQALIPGAIGIFWWLLWMSSFFILGNRMPQVFILHISTLGTVCLYLLLIISTGIHLLDALWIFKPGSLRLTDHWSKTYVVNEAEIIDTNLSGV